MNLLLENGGSLLQENGSVILLEQAVTLPAIIPVPAYGGGVSTRTWTWTYPDLYPLLRRHTAIVATGGVHVSGTGFPHRYSIEEMNALIILLDQLGAFDDPKPYAYRTVDQMNELIVLLDELEVV